MKASLPAWSEAEADLARRALDAYDGKAAIAISVEFPSWPAGRVEAWRTRAKRAEAVPEADRLPLRIETDPEAVYAEIAGRTRIPTKLARFCPVQPSSPAPEPTAPDDPKLLKVERQLQSARDELRGLRQKLKASFKRETFGEAIAEVIREAASPLDAVTPARKPSARHGKRETGVDAVLVLSDEHADEVVQRAGSWGLEDYDFDIFRVRMEVLAEKVVGFLTTHLPRHRFERLVIAKLGDAINGSIHDAEYRNHFGNSTRAALATGDVEAQAIQYIYRETGIPIDVVGVSGNHPRTTQKKDYDDPHANLDFLVGTQIASRLANEPEVNVYLPRAYTAFFELRGHLFAMNHGDDIRGNYGGIPWYGFTRKNTKVQAMLSAANERVSYFLYGHYHTAAQIPAGGGESIHNGAFPATSPYALEAISGAGKPLQKLLVVDEEQGVMFPIPLNIRDREREARLRAGDLAPSFGSETILDHVDGHVVRDSGLVVVGR